jgi:hypothetical protein
MGKTVAAMTLYTTILFLLGTSPTLAQTGGSNQVKPKPVSKEMVLDMYANAIPKRICQPETGFSTCLAIDLQECNDIAWKAANSCKDELARTMPNFLREKDEYVSWGQEFSRCHAFKMLNEKKKDFNDFDACLKQFNDRKGK